VTRGEEESWRSGVERTGKGSCAVSVHGRGGGRPHAADKAGDREQPEQTAAAVGG